MILQLSSVQLLKIRSNFHNALWEFWVKVIIVQAGELTSSGSKPFIVEAGELINPCRYPSCTCDILITVHTVQRQQTHSQTVGYQDCHSCRSILSQQSLFSEQSYFTNLCNNESKCISLYNNLQRYPQLFILFSFLVKSQLASSVPVRKICLCRELLDEAPALGYQILWFVIMQ